VLTPVQQLDLPLHNVLEHDGLLLDNNLPPILNHALKPKAHHPPPHLNLLIPIQSSHPIYYILPLLLIAVKESLGLSDFFVAGELGEAADQFCG
jgi:hypothetical protein